MSLPSEMTAEGRRRRRDIELEGEHRTLRNDKALQGLSFYQRSGLADLRLIRKKLMADIRRRGVMLPDGTVNPAVEAHRKNLHEQLYSISVYANVNRVQTSEPDLVAQLARVQAAEAEKAGCPRRNVSRYWRISRQAGKSRASRERSACRARRFI